jgi:hypothetical protein
MTTFNPYYQDILNESAVLDDIDVDNANITNLYVGNINSQDGTSTIPINPSITTPIIYGDLNGTQATILNIATNSITSIDGTSTVTIQPSITTSKIFADISGDIIGNVTGNVVGSVTGNVVGNVTGNLTENVTGTATMFTGSLSGQVTGPMGATVIGNGVISNSNISATAAIVDTKLGTISTVGKVANSATTATSASTPNTISSRDASGNSNFGIVTTTNRTNAGGASHHDFQTNGGNRFIFGLIGTENGSNAGSDFNIWSYGDTGSFLGTPISIYRASGMVNIGLLTAGSLTVSSAITLPTLTVTGNLNANGVTFTPTVRTSSGSAVTFSSGIDLVNGQNINNVGTLQASEANLYNSTLGYGIISGAGNLYITNTGTIVDFNHHNLRTIKSLAINSNLFGSDPFSPAPLTLISGSTSNNISMQIGRTTNELELGVAAAAGQYNTSSVAGDVVIKNNNASNSIILGIGTSTECIAMNSTSVNVYKPLSCTSATLSSTLSGTSASFSSDVASSGLVSDSLVKHTSQTISSPNGSTVYNLCTTNGKSGYVRVNLFITNSAGTHAVCIGLCWGWDSSTSVSIGFALAHKSNNITMGSPTYSSNFYASLPFSVTNVSEGNFEMQVQYNTPYIAIKPPAVTSVIVRCACDSG